MCPSVCYACYATCYACYASHLVGDRGLARRRWRKVGDRRRELVKSTQSPISVIYVSRLPRPAAMVIEKWVAQSYSHVSTTMPRDVYIAYQATGAAASVCALPYTSIDCTCKTTKSQNQGHSGHAGISLWAKLPYRPGISSPLRRLPWRTGL